MAVKYFDDHYYSNAYYARVGGVKTEEMNHLESHFLMLVKFQLYVTPHEYDQYRKNVLAAVHGMVTTTSTTATAIFTPLTCRSLFQEPSSVSSPTAVSASPSSLLTTPSDESVANPPMHPMAATLPIVSTAAPFPPTMPAFSDSDSDSTPLHGNGGSGRSGSGVDGRSSKDLGGTFGMALLQHQQRVECESVSVGGLPTVSSTHCYAPSQCESSSLSLHSSSSYSMSLHTLAIERGLSDVPTIHSTGSPQSTACPPHMWSANPVLSASSPAVAQSFNNWSAPAPPPPPHHGCPSLPLYAASASSDRCVSVSPIAPPPPPPPPPSDGSRSTRDGSGDSLADWYDCGAALKGPERVRSGGCAGAGVGGGLLPTPPLSFRKCERGSSVGGGFAHSHSSQAMQQQQQPQPPPPPFPPPAHSGHHQRSFSSFRGGVQGCGFVPPPPPPYDKDHASGGGVGHMSMMMMQMHHKVPIAKVHADYHPKIQVVSNY